MTAYLADLGIVCALGTGKEQVLRELLRREDSPLVWDDSLIPGTRVRVGAVQAGLVPIAEQWATWQSRNNRLLLQAALEIEPAIRGMLATVGPQRVGVVIGTSTAGIAEGDAALAQWLATGAMPAAYHYHQQELASPAAFLSRFFGIAGPALVVSTACTSSGNALLAADRLLRAGICDAVIAGGADSLCRLTLNGFHSLDAISAELCNPFSLNRRGINIGEGAAVFLVTATRAPLALLGGGATSDAWHISAPEPQGRGAVGAMRQALAAARLAPAAIAYLNLHGTATAQNDSMESHAVRAVFGADAPPCSSTKPLTGHTLGAASAIEAGLCWLCLSALNPANALPPHHWDGVPDPALPALPLVPRGAGFITTGPCAMMSNSFAFGGNNVSLIIGRPA